MDQEGVSYWQTTVLELMNEWFRENPSGSESRRIDKNLVLSVNKNSELGTVQLIANNTLQLINLEAISSISVSEDLKAFSIRRWRGGYISGYIGERFVFLCDEASYSPSRKMMLPRSCYPTIVEFLEIICSRDTKDTALKHIQEAKQRWSELRLLLLGWKDGNCPLSRLSWELVTRIRSFVDNKYDIVLNARKKRQERELERQKLRKRKAEEMEQSI